MTSFVNESTSNSTSQNNGDDHKNVDFKLKSYWNGRFTQEKEYDWLVKFDELKQYLLPKLPCNELSQSNSSASTSSDILFSTEPSLNQKKLMKDIKILIVGCGNSTFSSDLYDIGYENIINIDFSDICISNMIEKHGIKRPSMKWLVMDMTDMSAFENESFDVVIDKATMDALMVDEGDAWDPNDECIDNADKMLTHISRILKSDSGIFIQITFAQAHFRTKYLYGNRADRVSSSPFESLKGYSKRYEWLLDYEAINPKVGCINYFMYTMIKTTHHVATGKR